MKIISNNSIKSISASSENVEYPATNLIDEHPKKKWQAASNQVSHAIINIEVDGITGAFGMVGILADNVVVSIIDPTGIEWENVDWENVDWHESNENEVVTIFFSESSSGEKSIWVEFVEFNTQITIKVDLYANNNSDYVLSAGVAVAGKFIVVQNPNYGLQQDFVDYSIVKELSNGAFYYKKRDIVKKFSGTLLVRRIDYFYNFMNNVLINGQRPMMINIVDDVAGEWTIYGRFTADLPSGSHDYMDFSNINFSVIEVV